MNISRTIIGAALATAGLTTTAAAQTELSMWFHGAGDEPAMKVINRIIEDFNGSQSDWSVTLETFPQIAYNDSVVAAALAGNLPDILDVDGPVMPNWAWAGYLQPLPIDQSEFDEFLPSAKGVWNGKLYSIGLWDAAVALYARKSTLEELDLRTPTVDDPWTREEFMAALDAAKASGKYEYPLDLGMAWSGEWYPYAFSPLLQSFGGDLIDRSTYLTAEGALNGEEALAFGEWWQSLFENGYAPASQDGADRDTGFIEDKYAFSWNGNWAAVKTLDQVEDELVFLPAPDFGHGPKIGAASWQFGVSSTSEHPEGAAAFIKFATQDVYMAAFSDGIGLFPSTETAAAMTRNYREGGPLNVFFGLSEGQALVRPVTPGYVVEAKVFEKAMADIARGADVADTLDAAVDEINADIEKNGGYGHR